MSLPSSSILICFKYPIPSSLYNGHSFSCPNNFTPTSLPFPFSLCDNASINSASTPPPAPQPLSHLWSFFSQRGKKSLQEPSPQAVLSVGQQEMESSIRQNTNEPRWEESFRFLLHNPNYQNLEVEVRHGWKTDALNSTVSNCCILYPGLKLYCRGFKCSIFKISHAFCQIFFHSLFPLS